MANASDLKQQIVTSNALGRTNLAEKGVELSETATTYEIMQNIANIKTRKSYADAICEYFGIDKNTYPYIAVAVQDNGKTRIIYSNQPLSFNETKTYYHRSAGKTTGLVGETDNAVVFGWLKGYMSPSGTWSEANLLVSGTYFANHPIEETDTVKFYPL